MAYIRKTKNYKKGFTLIELLIVVGIIGILATIVLGSLKSAKDRAYLSVTVATQRELQKAIAVYSLDMDFYPPDVTRGWDPGLAKPLPYNLDNGEDCNTDPSDCPPCPSCPPDWIARVQAEWRGPYMSRWPEKTPWGGEYDYNYWAVDTNRYGCIVPAGIYVGAQGNYNDLYTIPPVAEQEFIDKNFDADKCLNGESQIFLLDL